MSRDKIAKLILKELEEVISINYNFEKLYLEAIKIGLKKGGIK